MRAYQQSVEAMNQRLAEMGREWSALVRFESLLIQFLQTNTAYVDSKDRSAGGPEIRQRLARIEERLLALKRQVEASEGAPRAVSTEPASSAARSDGPFSTPVDSQTYVQFEDVFRGEKTDISSRVESYVPLLAAATDVVEIGCGRGELLALLSARGVTVRGVDVNSAMVAACRQRGLTAEQGDALGFLASQQDGSIGGLVAIQVVEHMPAAYLTSFLEQAFHKMRPGAPLILETINPACWMAFFETYIRDLTHQHPLHPDTLRFLVQAAGFSHVDIQFRAPVSVSDRLVRLEMPVLERSTIPADASAELHQLVAVLNDHADKLNQRLFSSMDYVVVARR
jgi:2-polyprenyl-3-methyl-5-hydroxy-6-metoxy-1,4-benzoquinol methylase